MNKTTKNTILEYLSTHKKARVEDLSRDLGVSRQLLHRHLRGFLKQDIVIRTGRPPLVFYELSSKKVDEDVPEVPIETIDFIESNYLYVSPSGELLYGFDGFKRWVDSIKMLPQLQFLAREYYKIKNDVERHRNSIGLIDATEKLENTFPEIFIDKVLFIDFYSLPKFGKTRLGQLVLYSKQGQQTKLIKQVAKEVNERLEGIFKKFEISAVGIIPPTIPRQVQFLRELEKSLTIKLPKLDLVKAYRGEIPIAQKTLSKLEDRIENAKSSIFIKDVIAKYNNVLLIDDAVGSGASMNEVARKLKEEGVAKKVVGLAIVGSYKGFDVISEV